MALAGPPKGDENAGRAGLWNSVACAAFSGERVLPRGLVVDHEFEASDDCAAGHRDSDHFLIRRARYVRNLDERAELALGAGGVQVPDGVGIPGAAVEDAEAGAADPAAAQRSLPARDPGMRRVIERVFGEPGSDGVLSSVQAGVA